MPMIRSTNQVGESNLDYNEASSFPIFNLQKDALETQIYPNFPLNPLGLFAQTSRGNENATAFARLLPSAVDAEPESYQQEDETKLAAIAILKRHPGLLFQKGIVTDHFGRKIWTSAYQLFLGTGDTWALKQVHDTIIPKILDGEALTHAQFKEQFPNCQQGFDPDKGEEQLYDDRNRMQIDQVIDQLNIIVASITADPCTNGLATLPETKEAVAALRRLFAPDENDVIRTGLHFPHEIMKAVFKVYSAQFNPWSVGQLSFYTREVIGSTEAALTAVEGQCCKNGLSSLNMEKGPDRRDGLFCRHPKGIPQVLAPISNKLGDRMFVDPYDGYSCVLSSRVGLFDWYNKNGRWARRRALAAGWRLEARLFGRGLENLWRTKAETYGRYYAATRGEINTASPRR
jgi:hypothetical protein